MFLQVQVQLSHPTDHSPARVTQANSETQSPNSRQHHIQKVRSSSLLVLSSTTHSVIHYVFDGSLHLILTSLTQSTWKRVARSTQDASSNEEVTHSKKTQKSAMTSNPSSQKFIVNNKQGVVYTHSKINMKNRCSCHLNNRYKKCLWDS